MPSDNTVKETNKAIGTAVIKTEENKEVSTLFHVHEELPSISSVKLIDIGPFTVSNTTTTMFLIVFIVVIIVSALKKKKVPGGFQGLMEYFYEHVLGFISQIVGDKEVGKKIVPYVGSLLVFLIISNLLPMMPFIGSFTTLDHIPLFRGVTTDFNTTFALAVTVVLMMQILGVKSQGFFNYLSHFIQIKQVIQGFRKGMGSGFTSLINFFVGLIEIISELAKVLSLSLRLFGNMFAHEVLTIILLGAFAYGVPAIWMGMGVLVGVVQSLVFVALATVYFSLVVKKH